MRTTLAAGVGTLLPSAFDLNSARTMARAGDAADPPLPGAAAPMTFEALRTHARALAGRPYRAGPDDLPPELAALSYDAYTDIRFRPERTIPLGPRFSLQPFHRGFIQRKRVALALQPSDGPPRPLAYDPALFDLGPALRDRTYPAALGYAGFRLAHGFDAGRPGVHEEFAVFLGASYFRLRGRDQFYGLSARGVAVNTFGPGTEEFPDFTAFWIVEPRADEAAVTVLALLDGPSIAGAFRFRVTPGAPSTVAVSAALHPRRAIERLGLAPLTSMFLHGQDGPGARGALGFDDFRPQVHDSDGLLVQTPGDRVWRPLVNGRPEPRISAFAATPLEGFGLMQRERRFSAYLDVQARHEDRPGLWVSPDAPAAEPAAAPAAAGEAATRDAFAAGTVQLFEIPTREEIVDNVVAAFVPAAKIEPGRALELAYTLTTVGAEPVADAPPALAGKDPARDLARVVSTRVGSAERLRPSNPPTPERRLYAIDFEGPGLPTDPATPIEVALTASAGAFVDPFVERVPQTGGWRLYAEYRPPSPLPTGDVVLRARLARDGRPITETWDAVA